MKNIDLTFFNTLKIRLQEKSNGEIFHRIFLPKNRIFFSVDDPKALNFQKSAILLLLFYRKNRLKSVLIQRPSYNGVHSNQISLPGGKFEQKDINLQNTAIRETYEEISVKSSPDHIIGSLTPIAIPVSKFSLYPFVSFLPFSPDIKGDDIEVEHTIEFDIEDFIFRSQISMQTVQAVDQTLTVPAFVIENHIVWGATAMVLNEFREIAKLSLNI